MAGWNSTAPHGSPSRYRSGCRCSECRVAHNEDTTAFRDNRKYGPGGPRGPQWRKQVLESLAKTGSVIDTAKELGVSHQAIYGAAVAIAEFGEKVDQLMQAQDA